MTKIQTVDMDVMSELASAIVERQFNKDNANNNNSHSFFDDNGDWVYYDEVQDEFNSVLEIIDSTLNPET